MALLMAPHDIKQVIKVNHPFELKPTFAFAKNDDLFITSTEEDWENGVSVGREEM